jgi:hypothetical protein
MPIPKDFYKHFFNIATERENYFRELGLYKVNKYFEKAG